MTITKIGRQECGEIRAIAEKALIEALSPLGVDVQAGAGSFDSSFFKLKFTFTVAGGEKPEESAYRFYARHTNGLSEDDIGKKITVRTKSGEAEFVIKGWVSSRRKYQIRCERVSGGSATLFTVEAVKKALAKAAA